MHPTAAPSIYTTPANAEATPTRQTSRRSMLNTASVTHSMQSTGSATRGKSSTALAVWAGRIIFSVCLFIVAAVLGICAFYYLRAAETELAEEQFKAIADRALDTSLAITLRKRLGTVSMASVASNAHPDASAWPFVTISGYETVATNLIQTSDGREMGFCPLVKPEQIQDFEDFAYDYYENGRREPFPPGTAVSSFGKGIWGVNPALGTSDNRYHDIEETRTYDTKYHILAPILHHNAGPHPALLLNLRFQETRGTAIEYLIDCSLKRQAMNDTNIECLSITDMLILTSQEVEPGPGALIMQPIYPANDPLTLVGLIASSVVWSEVLENVFSEEVSGVDCVIQTETQRYTYHVEKGIAGFVGAGDLHEDAYEDYKETILLTDPGAGLFSSVSPTYRLSLYPTQQFFNVYRTNNPRAATIGAVAIIIFTSLIFVFYDFCVRKEFNAKKDLLEAKRKFVRFVSHEVRTPLNSVCMGLTLVQQEIDLFLAQLEKNKDDGPLAKTTKDKHTMIEPPNDNEVSKAKPKEGGDMVIDNTEESVRDWFQLTHEILNNAQSSVDVLNDLLNYDKIEMGTLNLELSIIPIWNLIEQTTSEFKLPAAKKRIKFNVDFRRLDPSASEETPITAQSLPRDVLDSKVVGDGVRVTQVLRNLVSNGLKFTPEEGNLTVNLSWIRPSTDQIELNKLYHQETFTNEVTNEESEQAEKSSEVELKKNGKDKLTLHKFILNNGETVSFPSNGLLKVDVVDTGAGMSQEQVAKLFRAGVQFNVNELQAGQGSGLGLFIAKGIMEQHGGSLEVASPGLGLGTTFTMTLPLYHVPDPKRPDKADEFYVVNHDTAEAESSLPLRVLIVDDAATNRKLLNRLLKNHGHTCVEAEDGLVAVNRVTKDQDAGLRFDTILMDYEMPIMDGPSACEALRLLGCDSFIVGITGNVLPEDVAAFKNSGANAVLPKPFKFPDLEGLWVEFGVNGRNA